MGIPCNNGSKAGAGSEDRDPWDHPPNPSPARTRLSPMSPGPMDLFFLQYTPACIFNKK